jgi:hypothetical protein
VPGVKLLVCQVVGKAEARGLEIAGCEFGIPGDARKHARTDLLSIVKRPRKLGPTGSFEDAM